MISRVIRFCLENRLVVLLAVLLVTAWGLMVAPFDWELPVPRDPVPVDAIPDIGENQQIVFTGWPGRSPQDMEDQVTYPLTTALLGLPGVRTVRSFSFLGFSTIYVIFDDSVEFYWSRSRVLEKLASLPPGTLPEGARPALGPDATALGQVFWYTLEGQDREGNPTGGWDLHELRSIQDWQVRYALLGVRGVSEVASVGGYVQEYQVDVDPDAMRAWGVTLPQVVQAVRSSNLDVGARTIEINRVEYVIRGLGFLQDLEDLENTVVGTRDSVPVYVRNVATVSLGPAARRGALDREGSEAVGGVVVVRFGENPLATINRIKEKIAAIAPGLPRKLLVDWEQTNQREVEAWGRERGLAILRGGLVDQEVVLDHLSVHPEEELPAWASISQVRVVPFYDRTGLIQETLGTLETALTEEILVTILVVIIMVWHLRSSMLISGLLPLTVLMCFIMMKRFGVDANIVALSGIAIAIGTIVDMGIVVCENILKHLEEADESEPTMEVVHTAASEVGGAVLTAIATTVVSFLPVFTMEAAEGKLFRPLAFTKTFALLASVVVALTMLPAFAHVIVAGRLRRGVLRHLFYLALLVLGLVAGLVLAWWAGAIVAGLALLGWSRPHLPRWLGGSLGTLVSLAAVAVVAWFLGAHWLPLGPGVSLARNLIFVVVLLGGLMLLVLLFQWLYPWILRWCLDHKLLFLLVPAGLVIWGLVIWLGFSRVFAFVPWTAERLGLDPDGIRGHPVWVQGHHAFQGLGKEFMPPLDEGSYLFMPTTMPHASIGECLEVLQTQDQALAAIPEVDRVVGKIGRVESPLDPAPLSMIETVVTYLPEFKLDARGRRGRFRVDASGEFLRDGQGELIPDPDGQPYRQWRASIQEPDDIWDEIVRVTKLPGTTSAPRLQPIAARLVMLQSGMRAPMGVKVRGPDLETVERVGLQLERILKEVPSVEPAMVVADRIVGKPYLEIDIDREAAARYGVSIGQAQEVIEVAIGGRRISTTVEGRERYPVRVRYRRELRDQIDTLGRILVPASDGAQIPLEQLAEIRYVRGPQVIKSEDTFLVGYVIFDRKPGFAEVEVVEDCQRYLRSLEESGEFVRPVGVDIEWAGNFKNQQRAESRLRIILPLALLVIFIILYLQFRSTLTSLIVFTGVFVAWAGGFQLLWLYGQDWFLDFEVFSVSMRELFQVHPINMSVAVWVGFLALFGIATDDGVIMATYLGQRFAADRPRTVAEIRHATVEAGRRRIRPCLMTVATTILALTPVLTSRGRGSDIMVPMAIPSFGGMTVVLITVFVVPTLYCLVQEVGLVLRGEGGRDD